MLRLPSATVTKFLTQMFIATATCRSVFRPFSAAMFMFEKTQKRDSSSPSSTSMTPTAAATAVAAVINVRSREDSVACSGQNVRLLLFQCLRLGTVAAGGGWLFGVQSCPTTLAHLEAHFCCFTTNATAFPPETSS